MDDYPAVDPLDGQPRNLGFLLDSRLAVDGLVVLRNGRLVAERYRNGLAADKPRLLLEASRPLLNLLGAISISQGKLAADKPVTRYLPALASSGGLRKISLQRLLDGDESLAWPPEELAAWRQAGGWAGSQAGSDMRAWLTQGGRWEKPQREPLGAMAAASPEDDLLAWVLADSNGMPLSRLLCEQLLVRAKPEHAVRLAERCARRRTGWRPRAVAARFRPAWPTTRRCPQQPQSQRDTQLVHRSPGRPASPAGGGNPAVSARAANGATALSAWPAPRNGWP